MSINVTLIVQMFVFALLVWFTMSYLWPMIRQAMEEREKRIADGLAAAEQGQGSLLKAGIRADEIVEEARVKARDIVEQAGSQANDIVSGAREESEQERQGRLWHGNYRLKGACIRWLFTTMQLENMEPKYMEYLLSVRWKYCKRPRRLPSTKL